MNNYNLKRNQRSRYVKIYSDFFNQVDLVPLERYAKGKPDPFELGFYFIDECEKTYNFERFAKLEEEVQKKYGVNKECEECRESENCGENKE